MEFTEADQQRVADELRQAWAEGARPSQLMRNLHAEGVTGGWMLLLMDRAFRLGVRHSQWLSAWERDQDDQRLDRHFTRYMPRREPPSPAEVRDTELWRAYAAAESTLVTLRQELIRGATDLPGLIGTALSEVSNRGVAIRLLAQLTIEHIHPHLETLARLACVYHREIETTRSLIHRLFESGHEAAVVQVVDNVLASGAEEAFLRAAELYQVLNKDLLRAHLRKCLESGNEEIREIATGIFSSTE